MKLVIAEKPLVAQSIARVIGAAGRKDGYLEGNGYLVSWIVGMNATRRLGFIAQQTLDYTQIKAQPLTNLVDGVDENRRMVTN